MAGLRPITSWSSLQGPTPRQLPMPGGQCKGVFELRIARDARAIRDHLAHTKKAVVIGGGYIGLEAAASLRAAGIEVDIVEMAPRLLARVASKALSEYCADLHQRHDVQLHCRKGVEEIISDDGQKLRAVRLSDGTELEADLVLAGIGVSPESQLATQAGLAMENGIIVNTDYQTGPMLAFGR